MFDKIAGVDVSHELALGGTIALIMFVFGFAFIVGVFMFDIFIPWVINKIAN